MPPVTFSPEANSYDIVQRTGNTHCSVPGGYGMGMKGAECCGTT